MRIVVVGQGAFAEQVLRGLLARGDVVSAVYAPPDGGRPDALKTLALASGIPCRQPASYRPDAVRAEIAALGADLMILADVRQIVPTAVIETPRLGTICFHGSLLPPYRGGSAINWALINGETETGATIFWPDAGIDTGPILLQRAVPIGPDDSAGALYFSRILPVGVELMLESVALIEAGRAPRQVQDESRASYQPLCRDEHAAIDWQRDAGTVHNLIRGCDPQPGAHTTAGGERLRVYESHRVAADGPPGTVLAFDAGALVVAAGGGAVRLGKARREGTREKRAPAELLAELGVRLGGRLGA